MSCAGRQLTVQLWLQLPRQDSHILDHVINLFFGEHAVLPKLLIEHQFVQLFFNNSRCGMSCEANRSKDVFSKYVDSVLQKYAKIRSLVGDLHKNYTTDPTAKKLLIPIHVYTCGGHKVDISRFWISLRVVAKQYDSKMCVRPFLVDDRPCS